MIAYRLLSGPDDSSFCHKVSEALANGWSLYGNPVYAFDAANGTMRCAQSVTKSVPDKDYHHDMKLGSL